MTLYLTATQKASLAAAKETLKEAAKTDPEKGHLIADAALTSFLIDLGFHELVTLYNKVEKWYA